MIALFGTFLIMIIILAVLALIVVKALADSPWGTFTVRRPSRSRCSWASTCASSGPGRIGEISIIGFVLLMLGHRARPERRASPTWAPLFTFTGTELAWMLIGYGFVASVLPVWLLLAPRDYLSTFLKIGTIVALAIGIVVVAPTCRCRR